MNAALIIGLIVSAPVLVGFMCAFIAGARADEMAESHGDVVEVPKS